LAVDPVQPGKLQPHEPLRRPSIAVTAAERNRNTRHARPPAARILRREFHIDCFGLYRSKEKCDVTRTLVWIEDTQKAGWHCSRRTWNLPVPAFGDAQAKLAYDRLAFEKFHEHACEIKSLS